MKSSNESSMLSGALELQGTLKNPQEDISLVRHSRFREEKLEEAYRNYYQAAFGSKSRTIYYCCGLLLLFAVSMVYIGIAHNGDLSAIYYDSLVASCVLALIGLLLYRLVSDSISLWLFEATFLFCGVVFATLIVLEAWAIPSLGSLNSSSSSSSQSEEIFISSSSSTKQGWIAPKKSYHPSLYTAMISLVLHFAFAIFSPVHFPRNIVSIGIASVCEVGAYISVFTQGDFNVMFAFALVFGGKLFLLGSAFLTNLDRRKDFIATVMQQRELGLVSSEKATTEALVNALFPPEIASRLARSRMFHGDHALTTLTTTLSEGGESPINSTTTSSLNTISIGTHEIIADKYQSATIVYATITGLENIQPFDIQLKTLSEMFIAADHIAESHGILKLKSIGTSLLFVSGIPTPSEKHSTDACRLAIDLQLMIDVFNKQFGNEYLGMKIGISTGPVIAGVIGTSRPKYDVWGYTVTVAERLSEASTQGSVFVTRDIAMKEKSLFTFRKETKMTFVQGLGKVLLFSLDFVKPSQPFIVNTTPVNFEMLKPVQVELSDVSKSLRKYKSPKLHPFFLTFPKSSDEYEFLRYYTQKFIIHFRTFILAEIIADTAIQVQAIHRGLFHNVWRWVGNFSLIGIFVIMFLISWFKPLLSKPKLFWAIESVLGFVFTGLHIALWVSRAWDDNTLAGMITIFYITTASRLPFWVAFCLDLSTFFGTLYIYTPSQNYNGAAAVAVLAILVACLLIHWEQERQTRKVWQVNATLEKTQQIAEQRREAAKLLLSSVVPLSVLEKIALTQQNKDSFFAQVIPCGTVLVSEIVGFDELYKKQPSDAVKLLNSLFSHFDKLAASYGLEPLKTIADEYVVAANIIGTMPDDHANRIVSLAVDMISTLGSFNSSVNPTGIPISIRIGIHSDVLLSGLIKMKCFSFDCWGNAVPFSEEICSAAPINTILISQTTSSLVADKIQIQQAGVVELGGVQINTFAVIAASTFSIHNSLGSNQTRVTSTMPTSINFGGDGVDYGIFQPSQTPNTSFCINQTETNSNSSSSVKTASPSTFIAPQETNDSVHFVPLSQPIEQSESTVRFVPVTQQQEEVQETHNQSTSTSTEEIVDV